MSYSYARPHAPTAVGVNGYGYDNNGNLINAEGRAYGYDAQNRLSSVTEGEWSRSFVYDGDGVLRRTLESGAARMHYVTPDYQVNVATGEPYVYYRFGGRAIAWHRSSPVKQDHLSKQNQALTEF